MMESKADLRRAIKERLARLSAKDRDIESRAIVKELKRLLGDQPGTIAGYIPLSDEPDIRPLLGELLQKGWKVALPIIEDNKLGLRMVNDLSEAKKNLQTNLTEPPIDTEPADPTQVDCAIIPGRAFTRQGNRLGRGNGGFDRWIRKQRSANPRTQYIGVCFECQVVHEAPMEGHDEKVDTVVTARGILK